MAIIPRRIYAICEEQLRARLGLVLAAQERLELARARAYAVHAAAPDSGGSHGSGQGDALERKAIGVTEAEDELREALKWDDVFHRLDRAYPRSTREGTVAAYLYGWATGEPVPQERVCQLMHRSRQSVRQVRDTYVAYCALLAAEAGLLNINDQEDARDGDL